MIMGNKIIITGGAGFIGSHLADMLVRDKNNEVTVFNSIKSLKYIILKILKDFRLLFYLAKYIIYRKNADK